MLWWNRRKLTGQSRPAGQEQSACHSKISAAIFLCGKCRWAKVIACIVSIGKKIFHGFIKQPRLSFPSGNHFQMGGGVDNSSLWLSFAQQKFTTLLRCVTNSSLDIRFFLWERFNNFFTSFRL
jgi:hypothetical protein